ncbi:MULTISPECIES: hypothetical protein [Novosphingobium]|nr:MULTISPECIES: hypothetical protein [unclassified Novosphingobium]WRT92602.1 hypothetical protein U9J33_15570 [Novosphingobium sp. RL4]
MAVSLVAVLSSCGPKEVAVAPPPPPPVIVIPPRPMPPLGAAPNMTVPALAVDGSRHTVNSGVSQAQALWNLRSAYNVAALNCLGPQYEPILAGYKDFLKKHAKSLTATNKALDKEFRTRFGAKSVREREAYQTQVYNYFALPPVVPALCNAAMGLAVDLQAVPAGQLDGFAVSGLAKAEAPFKEFFNSYDQYRADLAAWESRYGAASATSGAAAPVAAAGTQPKVAAQAFAQ